MANDLAGLDPAWAWSPYQPGPDRPWTRAQAAHLARRAGFSATWSELETLVAQGPQKAAAQLIQGAGAAAEAAPQDIQTIQGLGQAMAAAGASNRLAAWWLYRMVNAPSPLLEKMTLFWHGHFATSDAKVNDSRLMLAQNDMLRRGALGPFEPVVMAISRDPAMLIWLDSVTNRRIRPNENYARELMELFCLGPGNYTEKDIREMARAFTGWEVRGGRFVFNAPQHDTGTKKFLGTSGNWDGTDAVRVVLQQPAAGRFIAWKLTRLLVAEDPELPAPLLEPIAQDLRDNGFRIGPVVQRIISSNLFYSSHAVAHCVRSPVDLAVGLLRALEGTADMFALGDQLGRLGQALFAPPSVKGWPGGRVWIDSSTLVGRINLVRGLVLEGKGRFGDEGLAGLAKRSGISEPEQIVDWLLTLLVAGEVPAQAREVLVELASQKASDESARIGRMIHAVAGLPEFQLS